MTDLLKATLSFKDDSIRKEFDFPVEVDGCDTLLINAMEVKEWEAGNYDDIIFSPDFDQIKKDMNCSTFKILHV